MHKITILTTAGSEKCEQAVKMVQKLVGSHVPALIDEQVIDNDPDLMAKYAGQTPVILIDDKKRFSDPINPEQLAKAFYDDLGEKLLGIS